MQKIESDPSLSNSETPSHPGLTSTSSTSSVASSQAVATRAGDLLLVIFIHGFKGTDSTFGGFPSRLEHVLKETIDNIECHCIVFPEYQTKGNLGEAVERFSDWLTTLTVQREVANGLGGGAGKARIVLIGHSMGGLLAADTLREMVNSRPDPKAPLWPRIIACIAFDTPYYGLHPSVFKNSATKAFEHANAAKSIASEIFNSWQTSEPKSTTNSSSPIAAITASSSGTTTPASGWARWAPVAYAVGGAVLAGAAAGTAYWKRDDIGIGYTWATDHMKYVRNLWDEEALKERVDNLLEIEKDLGVLFRTLYTYLPPALPLYVEPRTFILLPEKSADVWNHFSIARNGLASDEVQAHTGMFSAGTNDGYYELGLETAKLIREAVLSSKGVQQDPETEEQMEAASAAMHAPLQNSVEEKAKIDLWPEESQGNQGAADPNKATGGGSI